MKFCKLIPELTVSNFDKSLEFYTELIGFKVDYLKDDSKFAILSLYGSQIMIEEIEKENKEHIDCPLGKGVKIQIEIKKEKPILHNLKLYKYPIIMGPKETRYKDGTKLHGNLQFKIEDPDGYKIRFSKNLGKKQLSTSSNTEYGRYLI